MDIPATIQDSLTARLDRLGEAKRVAQVAATIGREFSRELLAAVAICPSRRCRPRSRAWQSSGLVLALGASGEQYAFKHALVRDAAYDSLLRSTCRRLHGAHRRGAGGPSPQWSRRTRSSRPSTAPRRGSTTRRSRYWLQAGRQAIAARPMSRR